MPEGNTGDDGIAHLEASGHDDRAIGIEAVASGYMQADTFIPAQTVKAIEPSPRFANDHDRPVAFVVDLYAGPRPTVELIVPAGYHGIIKTDRAIDHDTPCPPGQRLFRFPIASDGAVHITGPNLLERVDVADYRFRFEDNTPLSAHANESQYGFWWLRHEGDCDYFVVGDRGDYMLARSNSEEGASGGAPRRQSAGGGGRHGGGGGHRRGGMGQ